MGNFRICGASLTGKSHESSGTVCQDAYFYFEGSGFVVAAVADGLGSSKHSDIASSLAAKGAVEYCSERIKKGMRENDVLSVIKNSFEHVNFAINQASGDNPDDYDTTLTLAVFKQGFVFFGHAGDSGIIALRGDGLFEEVTEPQLGEGYGKERPVYPLASERHWVFGKYKYRTKAVFLMTDGLLNKAVPPLLENQIFKTDNAYMFYIYDNLNKQLDPGSWVNDVLARVLPQEVNYDDISLIAAVCGNTKIKLRPKSYYEFPSEELWSGLLEEHNKLLYAYKYDDGISHL